MKLSIAKFVLLAALLADSYVSAVPVKSAPKKAAAVVKAPVKTAPVPKKIAPVPIKAAPVKAAPAAKKVAPVPVKAPVKTAPTPNKAAPVAVNPVTAAKPPTKATAPQKAPVAKPVTSAKPPSGVAKPVKSSAVAKPAKASAVAKSASARPSASAAAKSCTFKPKKATTKASTSAKFGALKGRAVAAKQFHATCRTFAASIEKAVKGGTFALQPERIWPNEFTWSGGFYVTPDESNAQLFGATFLANTCADKGGVVVLEFSLDTTDLQVKEVTAAEVNKFRSVQGQLGGAFQRFLKKQKAADAAAADPPADDGIANDDNPANTPPKIALPTAEQLETMTTTKGALSPVTKKETELRQAFADFKPLDVVAGAGPLTATQKVLIEDASSPEVGMPPLEEPFNQVVLVTDKAMAQLKFVGQADLPECLAEAQPKLVAFLKKKAAANP
ncbi:hypothetical protein FB451DRAFT_1171716 [Mycena latifolia]|nr:hypothetical protein FB451DRAFT_1171716 [Mycena latifolia]